MSYGRPKPEDKKRVFESVLLDYKPISAAPGGPPNEVVKNQEALDAWWRRERSQIYKAMDDHGNIYLIPNPICREVVYVKGLQPGQVAQKQIPKMSFAQAEKEAGNNIFEVDKSLDFARAL